MKKINLLGLIGAVVLAIGLIVHFGGVGSVKKLGSDVMTNPQWFYNGSYFGKGNFFVGGNAGDSSFGVSTTTDGSNPIFSISSAGSFTSSLMSITTLVAGTFTQGGGVTSIATTSATYTLSASDFDTENVISFMQNGIGNSAITLPASSSLSSFLASTWQVRSIWIINATTTASTTMTISGGTGVTLKSATTTTVGGSTTGTNSTRLDFLRKSNGDYIVYMNVYN